MYYKDKTVSLWFIASFIVVELLLWPSKVLNVNPKERS